MFRMLEPAICNQCGHEFDVRKPQADISARKRNAALLVNGIGCLGILLIFGALAALFIATFR